MRKSTFTKALLTTAALSLCISGAMAAESDSADYQLTVPTYLRISKVTTPVAQEATVLFAESVAENLEPVGTITVPTMTGAFQVVSNEPTQVVYLYGSADCVGGPARTLNKVGDDYVLVFAKETAQKTAVEKAFIASPAAKDNKDAIAFKITNANGAKKLLGVDSQVSADWQTDHIEYVVGNGVTEFTYAVGGTGISGTFDAGDSQGTYKTTLTLTDTLATP